MEFLTGAVQKEDLGIAEILAGDYEGKNIKVKGAIHTIRDMGEVAFIVLRRREDSYSVYTSRANPSLASMI